MAKVDLFEPWVRIARTGTFKDSNGRDHTFSARDFDEIVANYNPALEESPVVYGHPENDHPARAWVKGVKREKDILFAQLSQITPETVEAVRGKKFKYVSMSLHPCGKRLRHVGLLGAVPPGITGLGPVEFDSNGELTINFSVSELDPKIETDGGNKMDELQKQIAQLLTRVSELETQVKTLAEEKKTLEEKAAEAQAAEEKVQADFSAYKEEQTATARKARLEALTKQGKVKPAEHEHITALVNALAKAGNGETVNFSSPSGTQKVSPEEAYWRELEAREASALAFDFSAYVPEQKGKQQPVNIASKL